MCGASLKGGCVISLSCFVWSGSPESHRFCDRVQDAYTMRCCPQVSSRPHRSSCISTMLAWVLVKCQHFPVSVHAGSWSCQWHNKICSEHHQYRNKQRYWQPCILFAHKNRSLSHITTSIIFKLSVLFIFSWLISKMVFAERGETISGGNFHGEYPAKVRMWVSIFLSVCCSFFGFLRHTFFSRRLWTFYLLQSMSWPLSVRGGLKGCVTPLWVSCRPSWSMRVDSIQASWLHIVPLLHWVGAHDKLILHLLN